MRYQILLLARSHKHHFIIISIVIVGGNMLVIVGISEARRQRRIKDMARRMSGREREGKNRLIK